MIYGLLFDLIVAMLFWLLYLKLNLGSASFGIGFGAAPIGTN